MKKIILIVTALMTLSFQRQTIEDNLLGEYNISQKSKFFKTTIITTNKGLILTLYKNHTYEFIDRSNESSINENGKWELKNEQLILVDSKSNETKIWKIENDGKSLIIGNFYSSIKMSKC